MGDDFLHDLIEQPDGTYRATPAVPAINPFGVTETCSQEIYVSPQRAIKKTRARMDLILEKFKSGASVGAACKAIDIQPSTLRYWRKNDAEFDQACKDAWETGTSIYEDEIFSRALNGTVEEVYHQGLVVGEKVVHHDPLLLRTAERRDPENWGKAAQKVELTGKDGGPLRIATLDLTKSAEELAELGHSVLTEEYKALLEDLSGKRGE